MLTGLLLAISLWIPSASAQEAGEEPAAAPAAEAAPAADAPADDAAPAEDAPANEFERWMGRLSDAGATVPVMFLLSILGVAVIVERAIRLRRGNVTPVDLVERVLPLYREGKYDEITKVCNDSDSTMGRVVAHMIKHRKWPVSDISMSAGDLAGRELRRHLLRAYPLAIVGALAPLLGLLGTVSGMVDAFDAVAVAGLGDVGVLGSSISKSLVTTMVGLVVAIPALFAYHFFKSRTQTFGLILEEDAADLINAWFMHNEVETADAADESEGDSDAS